MVYGAVIYSSISTLLLTHSELGLGGSCWHNFEHNWYYNSIGAYAGIIESIIDFKNA